MRDWNRRRLLTLAEAIQRCQQEVLLAPPSKDRLEKVFHLANTWSKHADVSLERVDEVKAELCSTCSGASLYRCNKGRPWLDACTFMDANSPG